jgi:hypothetical protein
MYLSYLGDERHGPLNILSAPQPLTKPVSADKLQQYKEPLIMWCLQGYYKSKWWHLTGFWVTIVSYKTEEDARKFAEKYNNDPDGGFEVRTRLVLLVNRAAANSIKLRRKKYVSDTAVLNRF